MNNHDKQSDVATLINQFSVAPENHDAVITLLQDGVEKVIKHLDGFISVRLLSSLDKATVVNLAQWQSIEHAQAAFQNPQAQEYANKVKTLVNSATPMMFNAISMHEA